MWDKVLRIMFGLKKVEKTPQPRVKIYSTYYPLRDEKIIKI